MASDRTMRLRAISSLEEQLIAKWNDMNRARAAIKLQPGKRHGPNRAKAQPTSVRSSARDHLRTIPRSIRRRCSTEETRILHPLAPVPGLSKGDARKLRNAAKRARRNRR